MHSRNVADKMQFVSVKGSWCSVIGAALLVTTSWLTFFALIAPHVAYAEWIEDGTQVAVPGVLLDRRDHAMASDGQGGAFLAWTDFPSTIYLQRMNQYGDMLWGDSGIVHPGLTPRTGTKLCSDDDGGAILLWMEDWVPTAQRYDGDGNPLWTLPGVTLGPEGSYSGFAADGTGGAVAAWVRFVSPDTTVVMGQRIDSNGQNQWGSGGLALSGPNVKYAEVAIAGDDGGGAWISWSEDIGDRDVLIATRIEADGTVAWSTTVADEMYLNVDKACLMPAEYGGVFVAWEEDRDIGELNARGQLLDAAGTAQWTAGGLMISVSGVDIVSDSITMVGAGGNGFYLAWRETGQIWLRHVPETGPAGTPLPSRVDDLGGAWNPVAVEDELGGVFVAWSSDQVTGREIHMQKIDAAGNPAAASDIPVCTAPGDQVIPLLVSDGDRGCIAAWIDDRVPNDDDVFVQRIQKDLYWGYPYPAIVSADDVPGDQGGMVFLTWEPSRLDIWEHGVITDYSVWRSIQSDKADLEDPGIRLEVTGDKTWYWQEVGQVSARELEGYSFAVPTLFDSTSTYFSPHYFQVIANTADQAVFWISRPDSGYSVDNLAPAAPSGLAGVYAPAIGVELAWSPNPESDLSHYVVYRGPEPGFEVSDVNRIGWTPGTTLVDAGADLAGDLHYKVSAVDVHENEGSFTLVSPGSISGVTNEQPLLRQALHQNFPNPFNPSTTITYSLAAPQQVDLAIFDVTGERVRRLVVGEVRAVGDHHVRWNGLDDAGRPVASGTYFYRLEAGSFSETKRMVLVK